MDTKEQLSKITVSFHWVIALTVIALIVVGLYMDVMSAYALYPIHKSIGVIVFSLILLRVIWRLINGWPTPVSEYQRHEKILSKIVHWVLILGTLVMPISGMLMSGYGGHGFGIFGMEIVARIPDPADPSKVVALNENLAKVGYSLHGLTGKIMIGAIVLHIAGALKHHFVDKDFTLLRMLGGTAKD